MRAVLAGVVAVAVVLLVGVTASLAIEDESHEVPTGVTADCYSTSAAVSWSPVNDGHLTGYDVFRRTADVGSFAKVNPNPVILTAFLDAPLQGGTAYEYGVKAVYNDGHTSVLSATSSCTTG